MSKIIEVNHLHKNYGNIKAVDDISFHVKEGELFGFLGVNGAGKSTTINMLATLLEPTDGSAEICGYKLGKDNKEIRNLIGVVFQDNVLDDILTIKENLMIRGALYEKSAKKIKQNMDIVTEILGISDILSRQYRKLSGGQKRRCELAKSLMNIPSILFLDEPTTGLDPQTRMLVWESIEKLRVEMNMTVFLTTHYMEESAMAQYIDIMKSGKIIAAGTPAELKETYACDLLILYSSKLEELKSLLVENEIECEIISNHIRVRLDSTMSAIPILNIIADQLDNFEVMQGTMDDVFINLTGKNI